MKIVVLGMWHLGSVTAACCSKYFDTVALDFDLPVVEELRQGRAPLFEPRLNELIADGLNSGTLQASASAETACAGADVLWVCYDTPVNDNDEPDVDYVLDRVRRTLPQLPPGAFVLVSSQLPVGTCARLERDFPQLHFGCSPENLRLGKAIESFEKAERAIVGLRDDAKRAVAEQLFKPFASRVIFMRTESAEMVKHALNSFLALSITFINEIARLCEKVGADAQEVASGLKSEPRIGPRAYLGPGGPFAGGTLARDVVTLSRLGREQGEPLTLIPAIKRSNDEHRSWALRKLAIKLGDLNGKKIALLGLVYTPNTDTLRRSAAVELATALIQKGAEVTAFDPAVKQLPLGLASVRLAADAPTAIHGADAAVVGTEWPVFREIDWRSALARMRRKVVVDANGFLEKPLHAVAGVEHICVGRP